MTPCSSTHCSSKWTDISPADGSGLKIDSGLQTAPAREPPTHQWGLMSGRINEK